MQSTVTEDPRLLEELNAMGAEDLLRWAWTNYGERAGIITSFQNTGVVTIDLASRVAPDLRVLTVDTLRLHPETYTLMDELEPKVTNTSIEPQLEVLCSHLRFSPEDRIAAPHIRHHRVPPSGFILERHTVRFTRVPAVGVVGASGQKAAEDAVLGVKHGKMLIDHDL